MADESVRDEIAATAQQIWNVLDSQGTLILDELRANVCV